MLAPSSLLALINHFKGTQVLSPPECETRSDNTRFTDMREIRGQHTARRALEVAAAGGHNLLMVGPPGAGKSMLASCLPGILPPLDAQEILEVSMVAVIAGKLEGGKLQPAPAVPRSASFHFDGGDGRRRQTRRARRNFAGASRRVISR